MESTRKGRRRSKSFYSEKKLIIDDDGNINMNGGDDEVVIKPSENDQTAEAQQSSETTTTVKPKEPDNDSSIVSKDDGSSNNNKNAKGRKRKASDMKSSDESVSDEGSKENLNLKSSVVSDVTKEDSKKKDSEEKTDDKKKERDATKPAETDKATEKDIPSVSSSDSSDMGVLTPQDMGKGKRARIPNKRYSDILLSPVSRSKSLIENGEKSSTTTEKIEGENETNEVIVTPAISTLKANRVNAASPTAHIAKKPKLTVDLKNPNYLRPFQYGWKRELVYRTVSDSSTKRNGDIYYYTPTGKKVRSMREVSENLKNSELTLDDFTFFKEPLGIDDPEKEIIRDAKYKAGVGALIKTPMSQKIGKSSKPKTSPKAAGTPKILSPRVLLKTGIVASPAHVSSETSQETPAKGGKSPSKLGNFKIKLPPKKMEKRVKLDESVTTTESPGSTPKWSVAKKTTGKWNNSDSKPCQPCSIRCQGVIGLVPTLQCRLCLCLYHNECVGLRPQFSVKNYVCKNCQLEQEKQALGASSEQPQISPPPLTPITALKSSLNMKPTSLPKLQRIPSTSPVPVVNIPEMPPLIPRPPKLIKVSETFTPPQSENANKSLLGSVTTWLPQNSKIQVDGSQRTNESGSVVPSVETPRPQYVEYLAGRKFLIIPKHNIVSVSPTVINNAAPVAAAVQNHGEDLAKISETTEHTNNMVVSDPSTNLGINEVHDIKPEPVSPTKPDTACGEQIEPMDVMGQTVLQERPKQQQQIEELPNCDDNDEKAKESPKTPKKKPLTKANSSSSVTSFEKKDETKTMDNYLQQVSYGYNTLLYVFQYLKVQDLLRAGCVCNMWRDIASHPLLWRTVRMKNSQVHSFEGLANTLQRHGTVHLDLRKMLLPNGGDEIWPHFNNAIEKVTTLRKIELCRCPASVVEHLATSNPKLEVINAVTIKCENMNLYQFSKLHDLKELRLKSTSGLTLTSNLDALKELSHLKHLSLTSIRDLNKLNLNIIAELKNLESLDLGECNDFPKNFGKDILENLTKLEKLRLEKGQGNCFTFEILEAVKSMPHLEQLELVNFDIKAGFDKALGGCANIKRLLIIPTYISQSATTNHMVLGGVLRLQKTLSHFVWGVTLELLRVTELFVDQCEEPDKPVKENGKEKEKPKKPTGNGDSIPVLKPVPSIGDKEMVIQPAHDPPQVEILPLPNLQKLLLQSLPTTRVKILKIPFHATWRQSITDSVN